MFFFFFLRVIETADFGEALGDVDRNNRKEWLKTLFPFFSPIHA